MIIGIVGLGLIGGSLAKATKTKTSHTVLGADLDPQVLSAARQAAAIDGVLDEAVLPSCDLVLVALTPQKAIDYIKAHQAFFRGTVIDCCGVKQVVAEAVLPLARAASFSYLGGHPMAGKETSGFAASDADLFAGASMILVEHAPPGPERPAIEGFFREIGFGGICYTTDAEHDRIIALTSQLAHIVSSAYVQSPAALEFQGFSAGSFHDMTRVAALDVAMWNELMLANRNHLLAELQGLISRLNVYAAALSQGDAEALTACLTAGDQMKKQIGRPWRR